MSKGPKNVLNRFSEMTQAWESLRPAKSFSGMTLEQFKGLVKPSYDARTEIADLEGRLQAAFARRHAADEAGQLAVRRIVNAVKGDAEEGEDGELYAAMGYVRRNTRSSGLTRRRAKEEPATPA